MPTVTSMCVDCVILFINKGYRRVRGVVFVMANAVDLPKEVINELAFTPEELKELERARSMPITFDEDCPETTPERAMKFRRVNPVRHVAN